MAENGSAEAKETGRLEAFSDGVFAIAITLLVLYLKVPARPSEPIGSYLLGQWPAYLAYVNSFLTILIMWLNHHNIFKLIYRVNHGFIVLNGLLLMLITFINYPTALLATYLEPGGSGAGQRGAALFLTGTFTLTAIVYNVLWRYASHNRRLLGKDVDQAMVERITREYRFGPLMYLVAFLVAFVSVPGSLLVTTLLAVYFAFSGREVPS